MSRPALSLIANVQLPFPDMPAYKSGNVETVWSKPVGGLAAIASGANVPVKGAAPVASDAAPAAEVIIVPIRLSPPRPR